MHVLNLKCIDYLSLTRNRMQRKRQREQTSSLMHRDNVGAVQSDRKGPGTQNFKPLCQKGAKERRDAVGNEVKRFERKKR